MTHASCFKSNSSSCKVQKPTSHSIITGEVRFSSTGLGVRKPMPYVQVKWLPAFSWETVTIHAAMLHRNRCLGARISKVSGGSPAVMSSLCKIQLLPEIPSGKRVDTKRPAQATITLLCNAAKQKKILVTVKAQPWDQRPAAMIFKFIYLYVFYIFLESSINKLYDDKTILQKKRKNVQGVCIHTIHSLTKSFQICQHHPTMGRCFNKNW